MNREPTSGPSGSAGWAIWPEVSPPVLALPDASRPDAYYVLPQVPQLARDSAGRPVLSLSLVLSGRPAPEDDSIFGLVQSGSLACDLTLALPESVLSENILPLYARQATFVLLKKPQGDTATLPGAAPKLGAATTPSEAPTSDQATAPLGGGAVPLGEATGSGAGTRVGLGAQLDQAAARGVLLALQGAASDLVLGCRVRYRTADNRRVVHIYGRLANIYDYLRAHIDPTGPAIDRSQLQQLLLDAVRQGALKAWRVEPSGLESSVTDEDGPSLLAALLKVTGAMLMPAPTLDSPGWTPRYTLGTRPDGATILDLRLAVIKGDEPSKDLDAPLEAVLGGALAGLNAEDFIHLAYANPGSRGGTQPVPRRLRSGPPARDRGVDTPIGLAAVNGALVSVSRALTPNTLLRPATSVLLASDVVRLQAAHTFAVDNIAIDRLHLVDGGIWDGGDTVPLPRLPVVGDPSAPLWNDRADPSQRWYAPEFTLVPPNLAADPENSTFQFTFREAGHDSQGRVALEGEALFTLRAGMSAATQTALAAAGNPVAQPIPTLGLSVTLSLPVRDDSGRPRQVDLVAAVTQNGDTVTARVALLNEYVRVAYGDLAIAGFQASQAQLKVAYTFLAQVPVWPWSFELQYVNKLALTPIARTEAEATGLEGRDYVDAATIVYRSPAADMVFRREASTVREAPSAAQTAQPERAYRPQPAADEGAPTALRAALNGAALHVAEAPIAVAYTHPVLSPVVRPEVENAAVLQQRLRRVAYATQTLGHAVALDAIFPCNRLGAFYRQDLGDHKASIGCQDSFSLGQTAQKLYEALDDPSLNHSEYQVYRSLCQPGRFLVVPAIYRITRYAPSEGSRAYRPAVYLYSTLDAQNPANNRCVVMATLQPDLPPWVRKDLDIKLARLHHSPLLAYVTEVDAKVSYTWSLNGGSASVQPGAAKLWDGFQVTLATDLAGGLQLQAILTHSGVTAQASFLLADGTTVNCSLVLDLGGLTGPWDGGPLGMAVQSTTATLTNHIERSINVSGLAAYAADGTLQSVPVDRTLAGGQNVSVGLPFAAAETYPVFTLQPGDPATLTEISSFVEDIHTNVVFVNLINYANHNLRRFDLRARLKEVPGSETAVPISEERAVGEAYFTLPLTTYLGPRTLQFQVTRIDNGGTAATTAWMEWDLAARGNVISLTWDLVS